MINKLTTICVAITLGIASLAAMAQVTEASKDEAGVLVLTFDDREFTDWEEALPVFEKYGAHATFFISGAFDENAVATAKKLSAAGHSIGFHSLNHRFDRIVPTVISQVGFDGWWSSEVESVRQQAESAGLSVASFAYPFNKRTDETDALLLTRFKRLRAGIDATRPVPTDNRQFFPVSELSTHRVLNGIILCEIYKPDVEQVLACVRRAAERKEVLLFTSHGISSKPGKWDMRTEWLERILAEAKKCGVRVLGFDELL